jgi:hypothetical protein
MRRVIAAWWPLAFSWLLMSLEGPAMNAVVARLANPKINLAAYGGVVFPLSLIIEAPIIMLLAASTALSKDWASFARMRRFMTITSACLTALHALVAFTPLYYTVVQGIIGAPQAIVEPARLGLMIMLPWTWSIAYRRFHQGVLIRFGYSRTVGAGTIIRLSSNGLVLIIGYLLGNLPGIVVAATAIAVGVISEAVYVGIVVRPVLNGELKAAPRVEPPLSWNAFFAFYIPLVMTSLLTLLVNPITSAALSRMPQAIESLAVWSVVSGLVFMLRSLGIAYNEVVVALLDQPGAAISLRRFANWLALATSAALLLVAATPFSAVWFERISALSPDLADLARRGVWLTAPLPALSVLQSWYQGAILYGRKTGGITEAVALYLGVSGLLLIAGVAWGQIAGLYIGLGTMATATLLQTAWLWLRSRPIVAWIEGRAAGTTLHPETRM